MNRYLLLIITVLLCGCIPKEEMSGPMTEEATIVAMSYAPSQHGSASGMAITTNGKGGMGFGPTFGSVDIQEAYAVVFKCKHGTFVVNDKKAKQLFSTYLQGQKVILTYREVSMVERDRHGQIVTKTFKDYHLEDVKPI